MMYTDYVKMLREFQFDAKNYLTTILVRHRSYMEPSELTKLETRMAAIYAIIYVCDDNLYKWMADSPTLIQPRAQAPTTQANPD